MDSFTPSVSKNAPPEAPFPFLLDSRRHGSSVTPSDLAMEMLGYARALLSEDETVRFLDPAFGSGAFYEALQQVFGARVVDALGYEIDVPQGISARAHFRDLPPRLIIGDFFRADPPEDPDQRPNLLICHPPAVWHHQLSPERKSWLQDRGERLGMLKLSRLSALYTYFMAVTRRWLAPNGIAGWFVPSVFLDAAYAAPLRSFLATQTTLERIHLCDPDEQLRGDVTSASLVVWYRNSPPSPEHEVRCSSGGTIRVPRQARLVPAQTLATERAWRGIFRWNQGAPNGSLTLGDIFDIKRGVVTGANRFFILSAETVARYQLPEQFLVPILPSAKQLNANDVRADERGLPSIEPRCFLLTCALAEDVIAREYPSLWRYLQRGIESGVPRFPVARQRRLWYLQEHREPSPLLCTYLGRESNDHPPFRFIRNHSRAIATNAYLLLYPKPPFDEQLQNDPGVLDELGRVLREHSATLFRGVGRTYRGGLRKIEPQDLGALSADPLIDVLQNVACLRWQPRLF